MDAHDLLAAERAFPELAQAALVDRRLALKLMAASAALAAAGACSAPSDAPLAGGGDAQPVDVPTTLDHAGFGFGVVVRTVNGNPVKVEGNPAHPASLGRSSVFAQAAVLSHYDPERLLRPVIEAEDSDWSAAHALLARVRNEAAANGGQGLHILLHPSSSPTLERMVALVRERLPAARLYGHRVPSLNARMHDLDGDAIVAVGNDFLGPGPAQVANAAAFMAARRRWIARGKVPRLIVAESVPTLTGARADRHLALGPAELAALSADPRFLAELAGSAERPVFLIGPGTAPFPLSLEPPAALAAAMARNEVQTLVIVGGNPLYDTPAALGLEGLIGRARRAIYCGPERNETAFACRYCIPGAGLLTGWGDLRGPDGSVSVVRPAGKRQGLAPIELLALLAGETPDGERLVRETHGLAPDAALAGGIMLAGPQPALEQRPANLPPVAGSGLTLIVAPAHHVGDGSLAGNAWAQELPDPITGLAWGNAATMAPATAARLRLEDGDEVEITTGNARLQAPVKLLAEQAPDTIGLSLGYGRRHGAVAKGVGADACRLVPADGSRVVSDVSIRPTGRRVRLVLPNAPFRPSQPDAVRWVTPERPRTRPAPETPGFVRPERSGVRQWAMAIDLDACIGCNACTIACQAENNVPVVGPDEAASGRVMHWLRVDRHERAATGRSSTAYQPIPCMHCETAPCEPVCPVEATTHSSEGLNEMTYQRCIGTRSCSNNCPYKVRRFNWFDYGREGPGIPAAGKNPRVSIRDRGVMEKCTYCVQRIEAVRVGDVGGPPMTACQQACPTAAITFGDLADPTDPVARVRASERNYALLDGLNLRPRTTYLARIGSGGGDD